MASFASIVATAAVSVSATSDDLTASFAAANVDSWG